MSVVDKWLFEAESNDGMVTVCTCGSGYNLLKLGSQCHVWHEDHKEYYDYVLEVPFADLGFDEEGHPYIVDGCNVRIKTNGRYGG